MKGACPTCFFLHSGDDARCVHCNSPRPFSKKLTVIEAGEWEIASCWWAQFVSWPWAQELCGRYFAWKVGRKYRNYEAHFARKKRLAELIAK